MVSVALAIHMLAAIIWIGGMFFAYMALRPAAVQVLEPPVRLKLWSAVFKRFFKWVWAIVILLPTTGVFMIYENWGGLQFLTLDIYLMMGIGTLMILIYMHLFFAPYRRMNQALEAGDIQEAARRLGQIRLIVAINLSLGLIVGIIASAGRYWMH